jgi:hypothetical protein
MMDGRFFSLRINCKWEELRKVRSPKVSKDSAEGPGITKPSLLEGFRQPTKQRVNFKCTVKNFTANESSLIIFH